MVFFILSEEQNIIDAEEIFEDKDDEEIDILIFPIERKRQINKNNVFDKVCQIKLVIGKLFRKIGELMSLALLFFVQFTLNRNSEFTIIP